MTATQTSKTAPKCVCGNYRRMGWCKHQDAAPAPEAWVVVARDKDEAGWQVVTEEYPTEVAARGRVAEINRAGMRVTVLTTAEAAARGIE